MEEEEEGEEGGEGGSDGGRSYRSGSGIYRAHAQKLDFREHGVDYKAKVREDRQ